MSTEVRFTMDEEFIKELQSKLKGAKPTEIAREALTMYRWALDEASQGRIILSSTSAGGEIHRLAMPSLSRVMANRSSPLKVARSEVRSKATADSEG